MTVIGLARLAVLLLALLAGAAVPARAATGSAEDLRARYTALAVDTASPFGLPLHLASEQRDDTLSGDIYSRLDHRYAVVRAALGDPARWCEIMILHPNVTNCRAVAPASGDGGRVLVRLGRAGHEVDFAFDAVAMRDDYLDVRLTAAEGPAGTTDYRIRIEAAPLGPERTLLHLAYAHGYGARARLALDAYFSTFGRDKVGFTIVGRDANGAPRHVDRLRGGLERNAMRYYLAIRAYIDVMALPLAQRLEEGLAKFVAYTERWPRQLREAPGFAARKRADFARMQAASPGS